jgi:hypothetical protein
MKNTALLLAALLVVSPSLSPAQPKLELPGGSKFNLGSVYRGTLAERRITLKNAGTEPLIISRVDVSCGCTGTMISNDHIAAGDTGSLLITFNSKNFRGAVHKTVTINSNDPSQPQTLIQFEGTVIEDVVVMPEYLWFRDAEVGTTATRMLTIKNEGKEPLLLKKFSSDLQGLAVSLPAEPLRPGAALQLPVAYTPAAATPVLAERMTIFTSDPHQSEIVVAVYGNVKPGAGAKEQTPQHTESKVQH